MRPLIGSVILLSAVAGSVMLAVRLTSGRDAVTGRSSWSWPARAGAIIATLFATSLVVGPLLRVAGIEPAGESAREQLRDELGDVGFSKAEVDCVEDRLVSEYGSVDDATGAVEDDGKVLLRPMVGCKEGMGFTDEYADCFADALADRFGLEDLSADKVTAIVGSTRPEDRQALAAAALVCQGIEPDVADCVIDAMAAEYPDMFEVEQMEELTAVQQQFVFDAVAKCVET